MIRKDYDTLDWLISNLAWPANIEQAFKKVRAERREPLAVCG